MTKEAAFNYISRILVKNNWYAVLHGGHCCRYFHIMDLSKVPAKYRTGSDSYISAKIYKALYEEFYLEYDYDNEIHKIEFRYDERRKHTWGYLYRCVRNYIKASSNRTFRKS